MPIAERPTTTSYIDTTSPGGFKHILALDGIRGLAVLMVLGDHLLWSNGQTGMLLFNLLSDIRESLWIGVNLFFALSGFLITGILWDTLQRPNFFRNFYARRALRIFPLYYGVLLTLLALTPILHFHWNGWQYLYLTYTANLAFFGMGGLGLHFININHFWSLQVEEQFYLVWPLVVFRIHKQLSLIRVALITCLCVLGIRTFLVIFHAHFTNKYLTMGPTFSCLDNLLYGCTLALLLRTTYRAKTLAFAPKVFAFCFSCLLLMAIQGHGLRFYDSAIQQTIGASLIGIGCAALIGMALHPQSRTARFFDVAILRFFGKYSYGLYVYHYTLDTIFTMRFRTFFLTYTHSKAIAVFGSALLVGSMSILVALFSYHFYEKHFLKLKHLFGYRKHDIVEMTHATTVL